MKYLVPGVSWATDATFPAGSDPWSGGPTKIQPSLALQAGGVAPNAQVPAQEVNWLLNNRQDAVTVQAHAAMRLWRSALHLQAGSTSQAVVLVRDNNASFNHSPLDRQRFPFVYGSNPSDSNKLTQSISADGFAWQSTGRVTGTGFAAGLVNPWFFAEPGAPGVILASAGSIDVVSTDRGTTWATNAVFVSTQTIGMHWAPAGAGLYVFVDWFGGVQVSTTLASATHRAIPILDTIANGNYADIADDGGSKIVFVSRVAGDTFFSVFTSTDGGGSFAKTLALAGTTANICYSPYHKAFVILDNVGDMWVGDGTSWAVTGPGIIPVSSGVGTVFHRLAATGAAIAYLANGTWGVAVAYTFDLGATWNVWNISSTTPAGIRAANGRFYVLSGDTLWQSGQLTSPDADLVV